MRYWQAQDIDIDIDIHIDIDLAQVSERISLKGRKTHKT